LAGMTALKLPADHPRPARRNQRGASCSFRLSPGLSQDLLLLSRQEGVTLFMILLAAFQTLLHGYSQQDDIVVGTNVANRNQAEIEGLIGFFVNQLVLRASLSGNQTFRELLRQVKRVALGAYTHQDLPFEKLVEVLRPERSTQHNPLFQAKILLEEMPQTLTSSHKALAFTEGGATSLPVAPTIARDDLTLSLAHTPGGWEGCFLYSTDLFDEATIARMARYWTTLLENICANPDARLAHLEAFGLEEKEQKK